MLSCTLRISAWRSYIAHMSLILDGKVRGLDSLPLPAQIGMHPTKPAGHGSAVKSEANRKNNGPESGEKRSRAVKVRLLIGNISERLPQETPEGLTHKWTVFVRPSRQSPIRRFTDRSFIRKVVFQLHETFKNRVRTVREPPFEVVERGYGAFTVAISIFFRGLAAPVEVDHELVLSTTDRYKEFSEERRLELKDADEEFRKQAKKYAPPPVTKPPCVSGEHSGIGAKGSSIHSPNHQVGKEKKKRDSLTAMSPSRAKRRSPERGKDMKMKQAGKAPRKEETGGVKAKEDRKEKAPKQPASSVMDGQQKESSEPVLPKTPEIPKQQNPSSSAESCGGAQLEDSSPPVSGQDASRVHDNNSNRKCQEAGGDRKSLFDPVRKKSGDDCKPQSKEPRNEPGRIPRLKAQLESLRDPDLLYLVADALIELEPKQVSMTNELDAIDFDMEHMSENSLRRIEDILNGKGTVPEEGAPRVDDEDGKASQGSNVNGSAENSISPLSFTTHISTSNFCNDDLYEL